MSAGLASLSPGSPADAARLRELLAASLLGHARDASAREVRLVAGGVPAQALVPSGAALPGPSEPVAVAIGAFDGVHRGHRLLLARLADEARARGAAPLVVTFSPDPSDVLAGLRPASELMPVDVRARALAEVSGAPVVSLSFSPEVARMPYDRFVREVLGALGSLRVVVVGADFCLGAGGAGDVEALAELGRTDGFEVVGVRLADEGGEPITATRVRSLVRRGRVEAAAGLLGRAHGAAGTVVHGRGEGTGLGFPTANVALDVRACLPEQGVYAGLVVADGRAWPAAVNVGAPPSFAGAAVPAAFLEANLLGFAGDLYGRRVWVSLLRWLRDSRPFDSLAELERVVLGNVEWVRETLGEREVELGGAYDL